MPEKMLPLDDFLQLNTDDQVEKLKRWKMDYTLKDIREAWNFKHSAQYYMLLKKLRIYERVVNKSDKFYPVQEQLAARSHAGGDRWAGQSTFSERKLPSDSFDYHLNTTLSGPELADKLERIAHFLKGEHKNVSIKLSIEAAEVEAEEQE
ncbi:hypothetical protein BK133_26545 [Paenibacillus sp. FSL H8-0548]|uniref:hypothetical protein n=1 Tax=Paenibacillus sp. FSL H8-0548 TaxID=1920422 RepID=UPI00096D3E94|nr:hypothetical protein [Paenibacillus sp. FSL H8-0548]OMF22357.1 hypothetical protein BK133_26545 [Paenibacillus sp. FSL H8-0548]